MACNFGVQYVAKKLLGIIPEEISSDANTNAQKLKNSKSWKNLSSDEAVEYAKHGCFVIGVWYSINSVAPAQHGHIVVVNPNSNKGKMMLMDTGYGDGTRTDTPGKYECRPLGYSFRKSRRNEIKYYVYKGN